MESPMIIRARVCGSSCGFHMCIFLVRLYVRRGWFLIVTWNPQYSFGLGVRPVVWISWFFTLLYLVITTNVKGIRSGGIHSFIRLAELMYYKKNYQPRFCQQSFFRLGKSFKLQFGIIRMSRIYNHFLTKRMDQYIHFLHGYSPKKRFCIAR